MDKVRIIFCALWLCLTVLGRADDFESAGELYDQGQFDKARDLYGQLAQHGPWSANLFYNLANAEFRTGASGRAVLGYERALLLEPSHAEARANLNWVREKTGAKVPSRLWWEHAFPPFPENVFAIITSVAVWVVIFGVAFSLLGRHRFWGWVSLGLLLAGYAGTGTWLRHRDRNLAIVTSAEAPARLAPADRAALADSLPAGSRVRVLSERGPWVYCALPNGQFGWVSSAQVERILLREG